MEHNNIPHFHNDNGYKMIETHTKKFMCIGATPPFDHPHIFINMGKENEKICPYCSTKYVYNPQLEIDSESFNEVLFIKK